MGMAIAVSLRVNQAPTEVPATSPSPLRRTMNRFEVKYLVATKQVADLVDEMAGYLTPDPHSDPAQGYRVFSIYWDTPDLGFFWEKIEGVKYRRKLRFRRYDDSGDGIIEIK